MAILTIKGKANFTSVLESIEAIELSYRLKTVTININIDHDWESVEDDDYELVICHIDMPSIDQLEDNQLILTDIKFQKDLESVFHFDLIHSECDDKIVQINLNKDCDSHVSYNSVCAKTQQEEDKKENAQIDRPVKLEIYGYVNVFEQCDQIEHIEINDGANTYRVVDDVCLRTSKYDPDTKEFTLTMVPTAIIEDFTNEISYAHEMKAAFEKSTLTNVVTGTTSDAFYQIRGWTVNGKEHPVRELLEHVIAQPKEDNSGSVADHRLSIKVKSNRCSHVIQYIDGITVRVGSRPYVIYLTEEDVAVGVKDEAEQTIVIQTNFDNARAEEMTIVDIDINENEADARSFKLELISASYGATPIKIDSIVGYCEERIIVTKNQVEASLDGINKRIVRLEDAVADISNSICAIKQKLNN